VIAELIETMSGRPYAEVVNQRRRAGRCACGARCEQRQPVVTIRTAGHADADYLLEQFGGRSSFRHDGVAGCCWPLDPRQAAAIPGGGGCPSVDIA
jgi:hypothetical protein